MWRLNCPDIPQMHTTCLLITFHALDVAAPLLEGESERVREGKPGERQVIGGGPKQIRTPAVALKKALTDWIEAFLGREDSRLSTLETVQLTIKLGP